MRPKNHREVSPRRPRRAVLALIVGILLLAWLGSLAVPDRVAPQPSNKLEPAPPDGVRPINVGPLAGTTFDLPRLPTERDHQVCTPGEITTRAPLAEVERRLAYRGPSTRRSKFDLPSPYFVAYERYAMDEKTLANLDRIISSFGLPYFVGRDTHWRPEIPDAAVIVVPYFNCEDDVTNEQLLHDVQRLDLAFSHVFTAAENGAITIQEVPRREPVGKSFMHRLPPRPPTAEEIERSKYHGAFYCTKERDVLQELLDSGETPPPGWRMPTAEEEDQWWRDVAPRVISFDSKGQQVPYLRRRSDK